VKWGKIFLLLLVLFLEMGVFSFAQKPEKSPAESTQCSLKFRRIFFPENRLSDVPFRNDLQYCPIDVETFNRWTAIAEKQNTAPGNRDMISVLHLAARLEGNQLVSGEGTMVLMPHDGETPEIISLDPLGLSLTEPVWEDGTEVKLGLISEGIIGVQPNDNARTFHFSWTLRGRRDVRSNILFDIELPAAPAVDLVLDLPFNMKPAFSNENDGLIHLLGNTPESITAETGNPGTLKTQYRRWQILLGSRHNLTLQILFDETFITQQQQIGMSQTEQYNVSLRGLELTSVFTFEKMNIPIGEIVLELERPLRPIKLESGDQSLFWTELPIPEKDTISEKEENEINPPTRILVALPLSESGEREFRLTSFCPIEIDHLWVLPGVKPVSDRIFWNETRSIVQVHRPLLTQRIDLKDLRETFPASGVDVSESDLFTFQSFTQDSRIGMEFSLDVPVFHVQSGTAVQWGEREISSRMTVNITTAHEGKIQQLEMKLAAPWTLDVIDSRDASRIADYFAEDFPANREKESLWTIRLKKPIDLQNPLRLTIHARCLVSALEKRETTSESVQQGGKLSFLPEELQPVQFLHGKWGERLLALDASRQYRMDGTLLETPENVTLEMISERFDVSPIGVVVSIDSLPNVPIVPEELHPIFQGNILSRIILKKDSLEQVCRFTCTPQNGSRLSQIFVAFTPSSSEQEWTWSGGAEQNNLQRIQATRQEKGDTLNWVIQPSVPRSTTFEFYARRTIPFHSRELISLPFFPDQSDVSAFLSIETSESTGYRISNHNLQAAPPPPGLVDGPNLIRSFYSYSYSPTSLASGSLEIEPGLSADYVNQLSCVWSMILHSRHDPLGNAISHVTCFVENQGIDQLRIFLPEGVETSSVYTVWVDGIRSSWRVESLDNQEMDYQEVISVPLVENRRFTLIELEYFTQGKPLATTSVLVPLMPKMEIPVVTQKWVAWIPPDYRAFTQGVPQDSSSFFSLGPSNKWYTPFHYFSWKYWFHETGKEKQMQRVAQKIVELLSRHPHSAYPLGSNAATLAETSPTWKELLGTIQFPSMTFWIDETALSGLGIYGLTPVVHEGGALREFERRGLVWLFDDRDTILLTSDLTAAKIRDDLIPVMDDRFWHYHSGSLVERMKTLDKPHRLVTASQWERGMSTVSTLWGVPNMLLRFDSMIPGWKAVEQIWDLEKEPSLVVVHKGRMMTWKLLAFLCVVVLTWPRRFATIPIFAVLLVSAIVVTKLFSPWWQDVSYGIFWGITCSFAFSLLRIRPLKLFRHRVRSVTAVSDESEAGEIRIKPKSNGLSSVSGAVMLVAALGLLVPSSFAQERPDGETIPYPVYIPVNPETEQPGEHYWIPGDFYLKLHQEFEKSRFSSHNWQITKAKYQGTFINNTLFSLKAIFEVELPEQSVILRLPNMPLSSDGAKLDRQPISSTRNADLEHVFEITGQGTHQLELLLTPTIETDNLVRRFEIPIPKVPDSRLELTVPADTSKISVPEAKGGITVNAGTLTAELGGTSKLVVSWPNEPVQAPPNVTLTQLFNLRARPNQVDLRAMFKYHVQDGRLNQIMLTVDPRYQLSGKYHCNGVPVESEMLQEQNGTYRWTLKPPLTGDVTIQADYVLNNFSGIGRIRSPQFSSPDARVDNAWLGISVDPSLEAVVPESTVVPKVFEDAWGQAEDKIAHAFDLVRMEPDWLMEIRQKPVASQSTIVQKLLFDNQKTRMQLMMNVVTSGETYLYTIHVPPEFSPDAVVVKDAADVVQETPRLVQEGDTLVFFFKRPILGNFSLNISGNVTMEMDQSTPFPCCFPEQGTVLDYQVHLHRDFSILLECQIPPETVQPLPLPPATGVTTGGTATGDSPDVFTSPTTTLLEMMRITSRDRFRQSTVVIRPNTPIITGNQILQVERNMNNESWELVVSLDMQITKGELDRLELLYPSDFVTGMPLIEPSMVMLQSPMESRGRLLLKPRQNTRLTGNQRITIRTPIKGSLDSVSLPSVQLKNHNQLKHYVALPAQIQWKKLLWTPYQLIPVESIPGFSNDAPSGTVTKPFHLFTAQNAQDYSASMSATKNHPVVLFHDVTFFLAKNDTCYGLSQLDIQSHESGSCELKIPDHWNLLQIQSGGMTMFPEKIGDSLYRIELWPTVPVQRIKVFFSGPVFTLSKSEGNRTASKTIPFPTIQNIPVQKVLWSLFVEKESDRLASGKHSLKLVSRDAKMHRTMEPGDIVLNDGRAASFRVQLDLIRLQHILNLFRKFPVGASSTNPELESWLDIWERSWEKTLEETESLLPQTDGQSFIPLVISEKMETSDHQDDIQNAEDQDDLSMSDDSIAFVQPEEKIDASLIKRLKEQYTKLQIGTTSPENVPGNTAVTSEQDSLSLFFLSHPDNFLFSGGVSVQPMTELTLIPTTSRKPLLQNRFVQCFLWTFLVVSLLVLCYTRFFRELFFLYPAFFGIIVGLFCLLFFTPSLFGWLIILIVICASYCTGSKK